MNWRVLHVIDHLGLGGAQAVLLDLAQALRQQGISSEVAAIHEGGDFAMQFADAGLPVHILASSKWNPLFFLRFAALLQRRSYSILHFHLQASNWLLKPLAALLSQAPRVAHDHASADLRFRGIASLLADSLCHGCSSRVVAVSPEVAAFLRHCEGVPASKLAVVPNGVDGSRFRPASPSEKAAARKRLGLPEQGFVAGALGRLAPEKNFGVLVEAAARAGEDLLLVIGGEGPCRAELEAAILQANAASRLRLAGEIRDRPAFYHALDAFLLPSYYEGLPMVVLEAMAAGLPIVASPLPGVRAALSAGGLYCEPSSPEAWASALKHLAQHPAQRAERGLANRERCLLSHSIEVCAHRMRQIYCSLSQVED